MRVRILAPTFAVALLASKALSFSIHPNRFVRQTFQSDRAKTTILSQTSNQRDDESLPIEYGDSTSYLFTSSNSEMFSTEDKNSKDSSGITIGTENSQRIDSAKTSSTQSTFSTASPYSIKNFLEGRAKEDDVSIKKIKEFESIAEMSVESSTEHQVEQESEQKVQAFVELLAKSAVVLEAQVQGQVEKSVESQSEQEVISYSEEKAIDAISSENQVGTQVESIAEFDSEIETVAASERMVIRSSEIDVEATAATPLSFDMQKGKYQEIASNNFVGEPKVFEGQAEVKSRLKAVSEDNEVATAKRVETSQEPYNSENEINKGLKNKSKKSDGNRKNARNRNVFSKLKNTISKTIKKISTKNEKGSSKEEKVDLSFLEMAAEKEAVAKIEKKVELKTDTKISKSKGHDAAFIAKQAELNAQQQVHAASELDVLASSESMVETSTELSSRQLSDLSSLEIAMMEKKAEESVAWINTSSETKFSGKVRNVPGDNTESFVKVGIMTKARNAVEKFVETMPASKSSSGTLIETDFGETSSNLFKSSTTETSEPPVKEEKPLPSSDSPEDSESVFEDVYVLSSPIGVEKYDTGKTEEIITNTPLAVDEICDRRKMSETVRVSSTAPFSSLPIIPRDKDYLSALSGTGSGPISGVGQSNYLSSIQGEGNAISGSGVSGYLENVNENDPARISEMLVQKSEELVEGEKENDPLTTTTSSYFSESKSNLSTGYLRDYDEEAENLMNETPDPDQFQDQQNIRSSREVEGYEQFAQKSRIQKQAQDPTTATTSSYFSESKSELSIRDVYFKQFTEPKIGTFNKSISKPSSKSVILSLDPSQADNMTPGAQKAQMPPSKIEKSTLPIYSDVRSKRQGEPKPVNLDERVEPKDLPVDAATTSKVQGFKQDEEGRNDVDGENDDDDTWNFSKFMKNSSSSSESMKEEKKFAPVVTSKRLKKCSKSIHRTQRIMEKTPLGGQMGESGVSTWNSFVKCEENWRKMRNSNAFDYNRASPSGVPPPQSFVTTDGAAGNSRAWKKLKDQHKNSSDIQKQCYTVLDYDVVVCGGTLGIFTALALQLKGRNVCVIEGGKVQGGEQEWNVSMDELMELVDLGVLTEEDLDNAINTEFSVCRTGFKNREAPSNGSYFDNGIGYEVDIPDVMNLGIAPKILIEIVKRRFLGNGGVVKELAPINGIVVSEKLGAALDLGANTEPITTRLVLDCMGSASPISQQQRYGMKPDGVCCLVGSCARGYDKETNVKGDIVYTNSEMQDKGKEGMHQYFWGAFPVGIGRNGNMPGSSDEKTTYMFTYLDANKDRPDMITMMEDYWDMLPIYQPSIKDPEKDLDVTRVLFDIFPTYLDSPLKPAYSRLLATCEAAGIQSTFSFGGFGALTRNLGRVTGAVDEALKFDLLSKSDLAEINAYTPNLSAALMFQKAMSVPVGQKVDSKFVNRLLAINFQIMDQMGTDAIKPFLLDDIRIDGVIGSLARSFMADPVFVPTIVGHIGSSTLVDWLGHISNIAAYTIADSLVSPLIEDYVNKMEDKKERFIWRRRMEAWKFGSGSGADYRK